MLPTIRPNHNQLRGVINAAKAPYRFGQPKAAAPALSNIIVIIVIAVHSKAAGVRPVGVVHYSSFNDAVLMMRCIQTVTNAK